MFQKLKCSSTSYQISHYFAVCRLVVSLVCGESQTIPRRHRHILNLSVSSFLVKDGTLQSYFTVECKYILNECRLQYFVKKKTYKSCKPTL